MSQVVAKNDMSKPVVEKMKKEIQNGEALKKDFIRYAIKAPKKEFDRYMKAFTKYVATAKDLQTKAKVYVNK
eukprot:6620266-Lingulodinium_polyedra.AAC.1